MAPESENPLCPTCGADVRPGTSFCYKCGGPVAASAETASVATEGEQAAVSSAWFKEDISAPEEKIADAPEFVDTIPDSEPAPEIDPEPMLISAVDDEESTQTETIEPEIAPVAIKPKEGPFKPKPVSPDTLKRKPRPPREKIEMVWEEPASSTNPVFIIGTIVIFILVLLILFFVYLMK